MIKKKIKNKTQTWYRKKCVEIAKLLAKHRDNYVCQKCGKRAEQGYKIDGSHVKPESHYHNISADPLNIKALCFTCHDWWHSNPTESGKWFSDTFPDRQKELNIRAMNKDKIDWKEKQNQLKKEYQNIING